MGGGRYAKSPILRSVCEWALHPAVSGRGPHFGEQTQLETMKRAIMLAALPLACAASPAFVHHTALASNRPKLGDVSARSSAIAPQPPCCRPDRAKHQQQRHRGGQLEASLGGAGSPSVAGAAISSASVVLAWFPPAIVAVVGVLVAASVVNVLQGGVRGDLGLTSDKILGVRAEEATAEHVASLGTWF